MKHHCFLLFLFLGWGRHYLWYTFWYTFSTFHGKNILTKPLQVLRNFNSFFEGTLRFTILRLVTVCVLDKEAGSLILFRIYPWLFIGKVKKRWCDVDITVLTYIPVRNMKQSSNTTKRVKHYNNSTSNKALYTYILNSSYRRPISINNTHKQSTTT
jgi:hypothetical protein